jgi:outer membrane protein assembly factor BamC
MTTRTASPVQQPSPSRLQTLAGPLLALSVLTLTGCSTFQESKVDYSSAKRANTLEVPPDLTQLNRESRFVVPGGPVTATGFQSAQPVQTTVTAANTVGDVRIERAGNQRWLVVGRPADKLWQPVRDFWQENGFVLLLDQEKLGLMETDWAENRAKLPQDFIRNTLGKLLDSLYSTGERDKFRTRVERNAAGETEIFVSHRGMVEVFTSSSKDQTMWQPRQPDPELEAEFLRRLMLKLGATPEQAKAQLATQSAPPKARLLSAGGVPVAVEVDEPFDRAWRRTGLALDRTGFTVEDRDRAQGTYFVRYAELVANDKEPGMLSRWFSSSKKDVTTAQYRILVKGADKASTVSVQNNQGQADASATAQNILKLLLQDLQ